MRKMISLVLAGLMMAGINAPGFAVVNAPRRIFGFENDRRVGNFKLLQDDSRIAIRDGIRLWVYDAATGEKKWETKVKGGVEEGLHLVWNDQLYLMPLKKGLAAFDVATGEKKWETKTDIKMKDFYKSYSYKDNFLLEFEKDMISLNPDTGAVLWETGNMEYSKAAGKAGAQRLYYLSKEWGSRILLLGKKGPQLIDAGTGKVLYQSKHEFSDEIQKPVLFTSVDEEAVLLLFADGAASIDLKTGNEAWFIQDEFEDATGLVQFEQNGGKYCLFAFGKQMVMFDAKDGKILWATGKASEIKGRPYTVSSDGTDLLILTANNRGGKGGFLTLYRVRFDTGELIYKRDIANSKSLHVNFKVPLFGWRIRNNAVWYQEPIQTEAGLLFQFWGTDTRKLSDNGEPADKEGEGLVMIDPVTGAVVWRAYFTLHKNLLKDAEKISAGMTKAGVFAAGRNFMAPNDEIYRELIPAPVISGGALYAIGDDALIKIDLATGQVLWKSQPYGYISKVVVSGADVYGIQGSAFWAYSADAAKEKAEDVVIQTKKQGYFCLDAATGKQNWEIDSSKKPYSIFAPIVDKESSSVFVCDGRYLRRLDFTHDNKGFAWELDLKKSKIGVIGAQEGVVFKLKSSTFADYGSYTQTTKTYDVSMQHGIWQLANGDLLVIAAEGPARISKDGKILWQLEWEWKRNRINFTPTRLQDDKYIVYQYKKKLYCVDLETGAIKWMTKESKNAEIKFDTRQQRMFIVDDDEVTAYEI